MRDKFCYVAAFGICISALVNPHRVWCTGAVVHFTVEVAKMGQKAVKLEKILCLEFNKANNSLIIYRVVFPVSIHLSVHPSIRLSIPPSQSLELGLLDLELGFSDPKSGLPNPKLGLSELKMGLSDPKLVTLRSLIRLSRPRMGPLRSQIRPLTPQSGLSDPYQASQI